MKRRLLSAPVLLVVGLLLAFLAISWDRLVGTEMSWHGWIALALGCLLSLALAGVLMGLLFHSNRSGADERARDHKAERESPPDAGPREPR